VQGGEEKDARNGRNCLSCGHTRHINAIASGARNHDDDECPFCTDHNYYYYYYSVDNMPLSVDHAASLTRDLRHLSAMRDVCDVTFVVDGDQQVHAVRALLAIRSR